MGTSISRRLGRRLTAMGAGAALIAAGMSLGVIAPANADSVVTGGVTDAYGNAIYGNLEAFRQSSTGAFISIGTYSVSRNGYIEEELVDGVYKFAFDTGTYTEYFKDKADLATADAITVAGGAPVSLGAWVVDQPYLVGTVTNAAAKPLSETQIEYFDAATGMPQGSYYTDDRGAFKIAVPPTPGKLAFHASGYAREFYNDKGSVAAADPVTGGSMGASVGNVVLTAGGSISGVVTSDAGAPLEFVYVSIDGGRSYDFTDKTGAYTVKGVSSGDHTVSFYDLIGEYLPEMYNNVVDLSTSPTPVTVGVDQAVAGINAALTPKPADPTKTVEVTGTVKDSLGAPIVGARVTAYSTPSLAGDRAVVDATYSNRQGVYSFTELEKVQGENQFRIHASADDQGDDNAFDLFAAWYGGVQDQDKSAPVTVTPGVPVGAVDFVLDRAGGIAGSVTGLAGTPLIPSVGLVGPSDGLAALTGIKYNPDSTFETRSLRPGTYKVYFSDSTGFHAGEWWQDKAEIEDAVEITVKAGQSVGGLNAVLGNNLVVTQRPEIGDYPWVGKPLAADSGLWNLQTNTSFKYEWLVGTAVVGTGDTFTPTTAHIGDRLVLRVTAENGRLVGTSASAPSAKVGYQPKMKVKVKGGKASIKVKAKPVKGKKVKGVVIVKEIVKVKADGTIKYKKIAKAKIKKGKGAVSLSKLKKGKHKLVFFFTGKGKVGSTDVKKKVKR